MASKTQELLEWMAADPRGKTLIEIQTWLVNSDTRTMHLIDPATGMRKHSARGWWCTNLYEDSPYSDRRGILIKFCQKINGRWRVTEPIRAPFYSGKVTVSYRLNNVRKKAEYRARMAKLPKCPFCQRPYEYTDSSMRTPDNACITSSSSSGYVIDCRDRVFYSVAYRHTDLSMDTLTTLWREDLEHIHTMFDGLPTYEDQIAARQTWVKSFIKGS